MFPVVYQAGSPDLARVVMVQLIFRIQFPDRRRHWKRADTKALNTKPKTIADRLDALKGVLAGH